ncbi:hypothetical protein [Nakamurella lactea]|uniref:hypothetical protein n=1 Tax=Nakamurella lactea TaxID=459515 RepID=UPI000411805E|nr:hypothetical protein [Nakamurella lactea]
MLAAWSSWGAIPGIFDDTRAEWSTQRAQLRDLLTGAEWDAARRTTINAHYTDPGIVDAIWQAVTSLGLTAGEVLEPGSGSGTFIGLAPASNSEDAAATGFRMTGVELDPVTARIAQQLYPHATIRTESFANTRYPSAAFDAAVGNVPFADVVLHDRQHNPNQHSMHNHFILKSLDFVRPGGLVAVITSASTLDATNPTARREMYAKADLLGAVRLPTGAHRRTAGTDALTDVLVLRRREDDREPGDDSWLTTHPLRIDGVLQDRRISGYFTEHPQRVLGEPGIRHGMHGADTLTVTSPDPTTVAAQLRTALAGIVHEAQVADLTVSARPDGPAPTATAAVTPPDGTWIGMVTGHPETGFQIMDVYGPAPLTVPKTQQRELRELLELRDLARELLQLEAADSDDTPELDGLRGRLGQSHARYVDRHGPINRFRLVRSGRTDPDTGEDLMNRRRPDVMRFLRTDPFASLIRALEIFDEETQRAIPAPLLTERVVLPRTPVLGADTPEDAIAIALETDGRLDLDRIAALLGVDQEDARDRLGELVFDDPQDGRLVPRAEYLSGNVRVKLDAAQTAVDDGHGQFTVNAAALRDVQPTPLTPAEISPRIGAVWISADDYQQFLRDVLGDRSARVQSGGEGTSIWEVRANRHSLAATSQWGTERRPAGELMAALLEQRPITVEDTNHDDGSTTLNPTETEAARDKAAALQERFADWVWEEPERAVRLADEYNRRFNSLVLRDYSEDGQRLTLPGLAASFTPGPHQRAAVARMLAEPAVGLFHQVGAGKTAEMVMGMMELRRLGMASKPVAVVPGHMLEQFSREWLQLYPQARVLAAGKDDVTKDRRRDLIARIATGDWDGIVITHKSFQRIAVSPEFEAEYTRAELDGLRSALDRAKESGADLTIKRIEKLVLKSEQSLTGLLDVARDPGVSFEDTGIDYVVVDEAHLHKNLKTVSKIPDAGLDGSQMATDLHMKIELLRRSHGERVATLATATPIANSISEAHVMMRYLRPDLLEAAGVADFDVWAATFAETTAGLELKPSGAGYRQKTRFARFQNVPELLRIWATFADVKTAEDLNLPTPLLRARPDGKRLPETVAVPGSPELAEFIAELDHRADRLTGRAEKGGDNHLKIIGEGRHAALDMRLVGGDEPTETTKVSAAADRIATIWRETRDNEYLDDTGSTSPTRGALQLVFCDLSAPKADKFNIYDELASLLVGRGMPQRSIRFIHDANDDAQKARLFAACRAGDVAVLLGSTQKMGVGTNVQNRAIALHHLDAPWRPADIEQRDGRILRRGNQNPEIEIYRWATEGSFDTYMWQTLERKQQFITQVLRGRLDVREIDDIGDAMLSMAETKAITSGDPLLLDKSTADAALAKLQRLDRAHHNNLSTLSYRAESAARSIIQADHDEPLLVAAAERLTPTTGDAFRITIGRGTYTDRGEAAQALRDALMSGVSRTWLARDTAVEAELAGQHFTFTQLPSSSSRPDFRVDIAHAPRTSFTVTTDSVAEGVGAIRTMENRAAAIPAVLDKLREGRAEAAATEQAARQAMSEPFKHADELEAARTEVARINALMTERATHRAPEPSVDTDGSASVAWPALPIEHQPESPAPQRMPAKAEGHGNDSGTEEAGLYHIVAEPAPTPAPRTPAPVEQPPGADTHHPAGTMNPPATADVTGSAATGPVIKHGPSGTTVVGTAKTDTILRQALKDCGFKWSSNHGMWYLPRRMNEHNRGIRIRRVADVLDHEGRGMPPVVGTSDQHEQSAGSTGLAMPFPDSDRTGGRDL